ncbi:hypothetical protein RF11_05131 [Thelohanellus kitauei]|uniref:Uncharacterized protein n=1 Tax=Thelohanellus kitauei TaxID=669202 RepID=A0A0C2MTI7_THEKT|nr:hypothetical protein RF11_05131 [Thelohanellus kitauei]
MSFILRESNIFNHIRKYHFQRPIQGFLKDLILALRDEIYIYKIKRNQKLFPYEDLKTNYISIFKDDLINHVFSRCTSEIMDKSSPPILQLSDCPEYKYKPNYLKFSDELNVCPVEFCAAVILRAVYSKNFDDKKPNLTGNGRYLNSWTNWDMTNANLDRKLCIFCI